MEATQIEKIQAWIDNRFGVPNTFNTQLLLDFASWYVKEAGYVQPEWKRRRGE